MVVPGFVATYPKTTQMKRERDSENENNVLAKAKVIKKHKVTSESVKKE